MESPDLERWGGGNVVCGRGWGCLRSAGMGLEPFLNGERAPLVVVEEHCPGGWVFAEMGVDGGGEVSG